MSRSVSYGTSVTMSFAGNRLRDVADPSSAQDAATKNYVDTATPANSFAAPSFTLSTAAAQGSSTSLVRSNATIVAFDTTVPTTQAFGDSAATGSAAVAARRDHKHAMPADPFTGATAGGHLTGTYPNPSIANSVVTEAKLTLADNTTADVSTTKHGFAPKAPNDATKYLDGTGAFSTPSGTGTTVIAARVYNSAATSLADSTATVLPFDTENFDTDTIHTTGATSSRLTATTAGKYVIQGQVEFAASALGVRTLEILLNGTTVIASNRKLSLSAGVTQMQVETVYALSATDYVELRATQTSGTALNADNGLGTTWFGMVAQAPQGATGAAGGASIGNSELVYRYTVAGSDKASIDTGVDTSEAGSGDWTNGDVLEVMFIGRTDEAAAAVNVDWTLNNDTAAHYDLQSLLGIGTTAAAGQTLGGTAWAVTCHGSGGTASYPASHSIKINAYNKTTFNKVADFDVAIGDSTSGANHYAMKFAGGWINTAAVNRVKVAAQGAAKLKVGTQIIVYKRRAS